MTEPAGAPVAGIELVHDIERDLLDRYEHHLCNAFPGLYLVTLATAVPARDEHLPLVIRIDETGQVAEHQSMFVAKTGSR